MAPTDRIERDWFVSSAMELGIGIGWLATSWSAPVVKFPITSSLDGGVMFDAALLDDLILEARPCPRPF